MVPKIRIWDREKKRMVYINLEDSVNFHIEDLYYLRDKNAIKMMSSGGVASNQLEVYEGDILAGGVVRYRAKYCDWIVKYKRDDEPLFDLLIFDVQGNIYENPELVPEWISQEGGA